MGLPRLVEALLQRSAYPSSTGGGEASGAGVQLIQTHISYIFFVGDYVYKIKKPVNFGFLDFSTLDKRRFYTGEEVRLNRRLTQDIYLGVVPVTEGEDGFTVEGSSGKVVEYAVKMKRLDGSRVLLELIKADKADRELIRRLAERLALFYREAEGGERISSFGSPEVIEANVTENFTQTEGFIGETISKERFNALRDYSKEFIANNTELFRRRMAEGRIRDCHGDIHSDHISINSSIEIIDCIEFNERFRLSDTVSDIAFLSMDLEYLGRGDLSRVLEERYFKEAEDADGRGLIGFYKCYRAYVRGKVEGLKSREEEVSAEERQRGEANALRYFHLASLYAKSDTEGGSAGNVEPRCVALRGVSGSGKSTLARLIASGTGMKILRSDIIRKELTGIEPFEASNAAFGKGIYSQGITEKTYEELISRTCGLLRGGRSVIVDASFINAGKLDALSDGVSMSGAMLSIIECVALDGVLQERLGRRAKEQSVSDSDYNIVLEQKKLYENTDLAVIKAETDAAVEGLLLEINRKIFY